MTEIYDVVKRREDRDDSSKVYWDPIGTLFMKDVDVTEDSRIWLNVFAIGDVMAFPRKKREESSSGGRRF